MKLQQDLIAVIFKVMAKKHKRKGENMKGISWGSRWTRLVGAMLMTIGALAPSATWAWGPERTTYTLKSPSDHVQFNSITDNPILGDERNFVRVREAGVDKYSDEVEVQVGKEYEVYIGYHNNAASNLNEGGTGIALGAKVAAQFPTKITSAQRGKVSAIISAKNAEPAEVWDEAYLTTQASELSLRYVDGSAVLHNDGKANGTVMGTQMFDPEGTYIGYNQLDGFLPGCYEYSGYIVYKLVAEGVGGQVEKTVSKDGKDFAESVDVKKGDEVTFQIKFKNTGTKDLTNVTFQDQLPAGMSLVSDSTYLYNNSHPDGQKLEGDLITDKGYNTGLYGRGTEARVVFKAKVNRDVDCGDLVNTAVVTHDEGQLKDDAKTRVVDEECMCDNNGDGVPDEYCCDNNGDGIADEVCCDNNGDGVADEQCCDNNGDGIADEKCESTPGRLPETGPGEIAAAVIVVLGLGTIGVYWVSSRKKLKKVTDDTKTKK